MYKFLFFIAIFAVSTGVAQLQGSYPYGMPLYGGQQPQPAMYGQLPPGYSPRLQQPMMGPMMQGGPMPMQGNMMLNPNFRSSFPGQGFPLRVMPNMGPVISQGPQYGSPEMTYGYPPPGNPMMGNSINDPSQFAPGGFQGPMGMQTYPGAEDGRIITGNGLPNFPPPQGGGQFGGDLSGVSFFPFARIRPGPGLVIISSKEQGQDDGTNESMVFPSLNTTDTNTTTANNTGLITITSPLVADVPVNGTKVTVIPSNVTTGTGVATTTAPPCLHPIYMNRVFMSTALQMGLISANTSCVVLLDH